MRRFLAVLAALGASLALTGSASALDVGVTEDAGTTSPAFVYDTLQDLGMKTNVLSIRWDPLNPTGLPANFADIKGAVDAASARGVQIILATYQDKARGIADTPTGAAVFAAWLKQVAAACPQCVRKIIILNEPNQPRFFQPIFDTGCQPASPAAYAEVLAAAYDALKEVDPSIRVYGIGLSPRGNDNCSAASNVSLSPTTFLAALGKAYKAMGRSKPLMDALSFHPYPNVNTDDPMKGYAWPNIGVPNLDRLKQAFEDAFGGTAQSTFKDGLKVALDEVGWQVDTANQPGYAGTENVPTVDEPTQAKYYADMVRFFACDPSVESLNFFHLVDEADRDRFQSGLLRADRSQRASYTAVKEAIAQGATCQSAPKPAFVQQTKVDGGKIVQTLLNSTARSLFARQISFQVKAEEDATFQVGLFFLQGPLNAAARKQIARSLQARKPKKGAVRVAKATGAVEAHLGKTVKFAKKRLARGRYVIAVRFRATANPERTTLVLTRPFVVRRSF